MQIGLDYVCDRCKGDVGNGGVLDCVVISDLELNYEGQPTGKVVNHHLCRKNGCAKQLLDGKLTHYEAEQAKRWEEERKQDEQRAAEEEEAARQAAQEREAEAHKNAELEAAQATKTQE